MKTFLIDNRKKLLLGISAGAALALAIAFVIWYYFVPCMLVSLDVNPSIEYSVNHANRVLSAQAVNNDGSEILNGLDLKNKPISDAVKDTVRKISDRGYFDGDDPGAIAITTSGTTDSADALAQDLQSDAQSVTEDEGKTVEVDAQRVTPDFVQQAKELGISPGKLNLIQKLQASSSDPSSVAVADWANKPVKDILKTIKENRKSNPSTATDTTSATGETTALRFAAAEAAGSDSDNNIDSNTESDSSYTASQTDSTDPSTQKDTDKDNDNRSPNANATKNMPNSNANSNATKNWKYADSTQATATYTSESSDTEETRMTEAETEAKAKSTPTTHQTPATPSKSNNGSSHGKGNK